MSEIFIRQIEYSDNDQIAKVIRKVIVDFNVPKEGSAYSDSSLQNLTKAYLADKSFYYVVIEGDTVLGGAGIAPLANYAGNVCELQKMYLLEIARGKGIGKKLINKCIHKAIEFGYNGCYLETMPNMTVAQNIYQHMGFEHIEAPMGDTCHHACSVWMFKTLK
ncbi:GNAT family N-acetyltransferase [Ascidiimonas sp. W6]|uniref:GNAT family N-acetyltransferase n=1 Tax=Ascidiimonas meishanensis TaxID=3128903 RepID=UPI0030ECE57E